MDASFCNALISWAQWPAARNESRAAFLLRLCRAGRDFLENGEMLGNIGLGVLHGDSPLLVPPIRLRQHAAIDHGEPVVPPQDPRQSWSSRDNCEFPSDRASARRLRPRSRRRLQPGLLDDRAIAFGKFLAQLLDMRIVFSRQNFTERRQPRGHGDAVGVVRAAVEDFVLRIRSITARFAPNAASGSPPPMDFARQMMSGFTPKYSLAPPQASFAPVFTSSKISSAPFFVADIAQALEKTGLWHAQPHVHQDGLKDDRRDLPGMFA